MLLLGVACQHLFLDIELLQTKLNYNAAKLEN